MVRPVSIMLGNLGANGLGEMEGDGVEKGET